MELDWENMDGDERLYTDRVELGDYIELPVIDTPVDSRFDLLDLGIPEKGEIWLEQRKFYVPFVDPKVGPLKPESFTRGDILDI